MNRIHELHHVHVHDDGRPDTKQIGVYLTPADAEAARVRVAGQPGFREDPEGFQVHAVLCHGFTPTHGDTVVLLYRMCDDDPEADASDVLGAYPDEAAARAAAPSGWAVEVGTSVVGQDQWTEGFTTVRPDNDA